MKVSVVIAAYNNAEYIEEAIASILAQDLDDFECIVIDDGSDDGTTERIRAYANDERLKRYYLPVNCGIAAARNLGMNVAKGDYLAVMDADDVSFPNRLSVQYAFMEANPGVHILGARTVLVDDALDREISRPQHPLTDSIIKPQMLLLNGSAMIHPTSIMRMSFIREHQLMYLPRKKSLDHALWIKCIAAGACFHSLEDVLLYKRRHQTNVTILYANTWEHFKAPLRQEMLSLFYPQLSSLEVRALAKLMGESGRITVDNLIDGVAAGRKAMIDRNSYYGESRDHLNRIMSQYIQKAKVALTQQFANNRT